MKNMEIFKVKHLILIVLLLISNLAFSQQYAIDAINIVNFEIDKYYIGHPLKESLELLGRDNINYIKTSYIFDDKDICFIVEVMTKDKHTEQVISNHIDMSYMTYKNIMQAVEFHIHFII
jgi:hypothetical protein